MVSQKQTIRYEMRPETVFSLMGLYRSGKLELNPAFQRKPVWKPTDRKKLIDSMMRGYPVPAIVLYKRETPNGVVFDVIDGKQRLESIFMFTGLMRGALFSAPVEMIDKYSGEVTTETVSWKLLQKNGLQDKIERFVFPVIEVEGGMSEIFNLFVRINSTGKPLTAQEKRKAIYYNSQFLHEADRLARKYEKYFVTDMEVLSADQIARMKHVELVSEIMLSLLNRTVLQKKSALNRALGTDFDNRQLKKASKLTEAALKAVKTMFPDLRETRFRKITDFYTLVVLIGEFQQQGLILTDRRRNKLAWQLLKSFGVSVDEVRELKRSVKGVRPDQELYHKYWLTVMESTDEFHQRKLRQDILQGILGSLFERKDINRSFSPEQRRILWNTSTARHCTYDGCKTKLTWSDFTIDHIDPHSKGGRTALANAALMCQPHNSAKGNRTTTRPKRTTKRSKSPVARVAAQRRSK